jgi:hypothetical protein
VPEVPHWQSQERIWRHACRSRLRDAELEPNLGASEDYHGGQNQDVRSLGGSASGRPALDELELDIDVNEMDELDEREGDPLEIFGEQDDEPEADDFPYRPPRRPEGRLEYPHEAVAKVEQELRRRRLGDDPMSSNIVELAQWRR